MNVFDTKQAFRCGAVLLALCFLTAASPALAGPYSAAFNDPTNIFDAPVAGFVGPDGDGVTGGSNYVNPEFLGWASDYVDYLPASYISSPYWMDPVKALGAVTGNHIESVVTLGDLDQTEINGGAAPGEITLIFDTPIRNGVGADLAVFENGLLESGPSALFAEFAYVEVSSDGVNFAPFASDSLTANPVSAYGTVDVTNVFNLAGKHINNGAFEGVAGDSWGTPFDLDDLVADPLVTGGLLDLGAITHVKIVDIPGTGDFLDGDGAPIYDAWLTQGSGGFDLEAVGALNEWPDFSGNDVVDAEDIDLLSTAVRAGSTDPVFDLDNDGDLDEDDFIYMVEVCVETTIGRGSAVGDFNLDSVVNATDMQIMKASFGFSGVGFAAGNANCDDVVNATDLQILKSNFGFEAGSVPEPATLTLLVVAGAAGLARRRQR